MSSTSQWTWDAARQQYYYWSVAENCWIYGDGQRVAAATEGATGAASASTQDPRSVPNNPITAASYSTNPDAVAGLSSNFAGLGLTGQVSHTSFAPGSPSSTYTSAYTTQSTQGYGGYGHSSSPPAAATQSQTFRRDGTNPAGVSRRLELGPASQITDPVLTQYGAHATRRIQGTEGQAETLDHRYKVRYPGHAFFKVGKVIKMLWAEMAGDRNDNITISSGRFEQAVATKIRWFVVIREGNTYCSCLPITTYTGRGVGKSGIIKNHHAIIYTGSREPSRRGSEKPAKGELGMRASVRVDPKRKSYKMDSNSRVNYAKIYTVEHNVKVFDFGQINANFEWVLTSNFNAVWFPTVGPPPAPTITAAAMADVPEVEEEDEEDGDGEAGGDDDPAIDADDGEEEEEEEDE